MIFPSYYELIDRGFQIVQRGSPLPELLGLEEPGIWILARHLVDEEYEIHAARDSLGRRYDTVEINCDIDSPFSDVSSIEEFIKSLN